MRERYSQPGRRTQSSDTLDRLQAAMGALEGRIGGARPAPDPRAHEADLAAIRARQNALDGDRTEALRAELSRLRQDVERQFGAHQPAQFDSLREDIRKLRASSGAIDALHEEVRALRAPGPGLDDVRVDIDRLRQDIAALAREETLRDLTDRSSVIEREIASLPQSLPSRQDMVAMVDRLERVHESLRDLPASLSLDAMEDQMRALAVAVEQLVARDAVPETHQAIEGRLDEISRAISAIPAPVPAPTIDPDIVDRIEARIAALATQVDQIALASKDDRQTARLDAIAGQIDALRAEHLNQVSQPGEAIDALSARMEDLATAIEELGHTAMRQAPADRQFADDLHQRLAAIDGQLQATATVTERSAEGVIASLDNRMAELARLIDQSERAQADVPSMAQLERRLEDIAHALTEGAAAPVAPVSVDHLEAQIARLTESLASGPSAAPDQDSILTAARIAAEEAVARVSAGDGEMPEALDRLTEDLRALESLARDTDHRNSTTFEAIHDTLLKVVDHLAGLETSLRDTPGAAAVPSPPPLEIDDAPPIAPEVSERPVEPLSPARAAAQAAMAALDDKGAIGDAPPDGERRSLLRNVTDRFSRNRTGDGDDIAGIDPPERMPADPAPLVVDDQPIEPSNDQVALADIMARVRQERSGTAGGTPKGPGSAAGETGKSDFIAAARRAAKAAAADATVTAPLAGTGADSTGSTSLASILAGRRKPLLIGAGAILLALLSIPLIRGVFVAPQVQANLVAEQPPAVVETVRDDEPEAIVEPARSAASETTPADGAPLPREVLGGAPDPSVPALAGSDGPTPLQTGAALIDPAEDSAPIDPPADVTASAVTEASLTIPEIPDRIGPTALREAAAGGDAKALHVIGDWYMAQGEGGETTEALKWYELSAELGYAPAQYRTGNFYEKGFGAERDYMAARTWYERAAEQGNATAMHNLAVLHASGIDGEPDFDAAVPWFMRAAELGLRDSQFNLGILSAKGQGVPQDLVESYKWFALAAMSGDEDAAEKRDEVANVLRPDQLETARGATTLWKAKPLDAEANIVTVPQEWQTDAEMTAATPAADDAEMRQAVRNIQAILNNAGFDAGPVDGIMGERTRDAIIAFQRQNGLEPTGAVDQALVEKLLETNGSQS